MDGKAWELALEHIGNGVVVIDEDETIRLITRRAKTLFEIGDDQIDIGNTLRDFLHCAGRGLGWSPERVATVHANHRAWKAASEPQSIYHHYDDGRVFHIGYHPKRGDGAVLTYDDVTARARLDKLLCERADQADLFHAEVYSTVGAIATATHETRDRHGSMTESANGTMDRIAQLNRAAEQSAVAMYEAAQDNFRIRQVFGELAGGLDQVAGDTSTALAGARIGIEICERLAVHAQSAGAILDLIRGLASQGRLLSFNARIEAERAGDAGRGFCVVAQAVKDLADQTVAAATRSETELGGIRRAIAEAVAANHLIEASIAAISRTAETVRTATGAQREQVDAVALAIEGTAAIAEVMRDNAGQVDERFGALIETLADTDRRLADIDRHVETLVSGAERFRRAHLDEPGPGNDRAAIARSLTGVSALR